MNHSRTLPPNAIRPGFTLVELMLSIAMVLLLMIGINAIFRTTADTVGVGQAALSTSRELRNAFDALDADFGGMLDSGSQPVLMIYNQNMTTFRDKADMNSDKDYLSAPSYESALHEFDSQGNRLPSVRIDGVNTTSTGFPVVVNNRNHRVDIVSFFTSGRYRRQTGLEQDSATTVNYQSQYNSDSAYIWIGHVRQPGSANWMNPDTFVSPAMTPNQSFTSGVNPNGFFANQMILGRMAILLGEPGQGGFILGNNTASNTQVAQAYLNHAPTINTANPLYPMYPFAYGTPATYNGSTSNPPAPIPQIQQSLCDVAGISASDYLKQVMLATVPTVSNPTHQRKGIWYYPLLSNNWTVSNPQNSSSPNTAFRFACKPWTSRNLATNNTLKQTDMALNAPTFIHGCSQFIVEFAGDYIAQSTSPGAPLTANSDQAIAQKSDGELDFDVVPIPVDPSNPSSNVVYQKRIRWYGMARRYPGNTVINPADYHYLDVQPVLWGAQNGPVRSAAVALPFEKVKPADAFPAPANTPVPLGSYTCAWSPYDLQFPNLAGEDPNLLITPVGGGGTMQTNYPKGFMPWMIRLTIRVDDPNGRLPDGQTIQYVFNLPHK